MNKLNKIKIFTLVIILFVSYGLGFVAFTSKTTEVDAATSCCYTGDCITCGANECTHISTCVPFVRNCNSGPCPGSPPATPPPAAPPGSPPGTPAPPPAPPGCSSTTPGAAPVQVSPADGATGLANAIQFSWNPIASNKWGVGCPQTNGYYIYYAQTVDGGGVGTCAALAYSYAYRGLVTSAALNLNWGRTYCWRIGAYNGTKSALSGFRTLTVDAAPNVISSGFTSFDVCGKGRSGAAGQAGVTNPVTYSITYNDPDSNDTFKEIWLAFLIQTYTAANYTEAQVQPAAHTYKTVAMKIDLATGRAYTINNAGVWDAGALTGNLSNLDASATLMDIGTGTTGSITGNKASATFTIRFDAAFPTNVLTIHSAALVQAANGTLFTSGGLGAAPRRYTKIPGTWQVDVTKPSATLSGPVYQPNGTFNITWGATDALGPLTVFSYIYSDVAGSQIKNVTNNITTTTPGSAIAYPSPSNAGITAANLGAKNYSDLSPGNNANYSFAIYATDSACNLSNKVIGANSPVPWMLGMSGDISGIGGIDNEEIPTINSLLLPPYITVATPAYFSNYGAISGTSTNATGVISKLNQIANNYKDAAINSPNLASGLWYDFLLDKIKKNGKTTVTTLAPVPPATSRTILTTMSAALGATANTKVAVEVTSDLVIGAATASAATCNVRGIIFVRGNLTINPDFTNTAVLPLATPISTQTYNGCMFIVKGNVTINAGNARTPSLASNAAALASYDVVNAFIITDGTLNLPVDSVQGVGKKWDGLYINGGIVARNTMNGTVTTLKRDIDKEANNTQPALLINLDPRYKLSYADDFASRDYSVREFGL